MNKKFASLGTALSRDEAKKVIGGDDPSTGFEGGSDLTNCSTTCAGGTVISITNCNGTCTASATSVTCTGGHNTLTKSC